MLTDDLYLGKNYFPNRDQAGPHPVPPEKGGYFTTPSPIQVNAAKVRAKGPKFADHYSQGMSVLVHGHDVPFIEQIIYALSSDVVLEFDDGG